MVLQAQHVILVTPSAVVVDQVEDKLEEQPAVVE